MKPLYWLKYPELLGSRVWRLGISICCFEEQSLVCNNTWSWSYFRRWLWSENYFDSKISCRKCCEIVDELSQLLSWWLRSGMVQTDYNPMAASDSNVGNWGDIAPFRGDKSGFWKVLYSSHFKNVWGKPFQNQSEGYVSCHKTCEMVSRFQLSSSSFRR